MDFLRKFLQRDSFDDSILSLFQGGGVISKSILKIYFVIQERFLINDDKENRLMFPVYFFNQILNIVVKYNGMKKLAFKHKLMKFICLNCFFHEDFDFETHNSYIKSFEFGRYQIKKHDISILYLEIIDKILFSFPNADKQLKNLNIFMKFIEKKNYLQNFILQFKENNEFEMYILLYRIASLLSCEENSKYLEINSVLFDLFYRTIYDDTPHIFGYEFDSSLCKKIIELLESASHINENIDVFLDKRNFISNIFRVNPLDCKPYISKILNVLICKNAFDRISPLDEFFDDIIFTYSNNKEIPRDDVDMMIRDDFLRRSPRILENKLLNMQRNFAIMSMHGYFNESRSKFLYFL